VSRLRLRTPARNQRKSQRGHSVGTYEDAKVAIDDMYNDTSYSKEECAENLEALKEEIDLLTDALEA